MAESRTKWLAGLKNRAVSIADNLLATMIAAVFGGGLWLWYESHKDGFVAALPSAAILSAAILAGWNQALQLADRARRQRLANRSPDDLEHEIRDWLHKYGYTVTNSPEPNYDLSMTVSNPGVGIKVAIRKPADHEWIEMAATTTFKGQALEAVNVAPKTFELNLVKELIPLGLDFVIQDDEKGAVTGILFSNPFLFTPETTSLEFLRAVRLVSGGVLLTIKIAERFISTAAKGALQQPPKPPLPPSPDTPLQM